MRTLLGAKPASIIVLAISLLAGCGSSETNVQKIEREVVEIAKAMDVPPNLLPLDDLEELASKARVEKWGEILVQSGKLELRDKGKYTCIVLPKSIEEDAQILEGPC